MSLADDIDACLPQTQCQNCTYEDCKEYATAIYDGKADINRCPPGGTYTVAALSSVTGREIKPIDPTLKPFQGFRVAKVIEAECIGCTKCIQACPVDAILGGPKFMHTVIAAECTGCDLCIEPCPVDCIDLVPLSVSPRLWRAPSSIAATQANSELQF